MSRNVTITVRVTKDAPSGRIAEVVTVMDYDLISKSHVDQVALAVERAEREVDELISKEGKG